MGAVMGIHFSKARVSSEDMTVEYAVRMPNDLPRKIRPTSKSTMFRIRFRVAVVTEGIYLLTRMEMPLTPPVVK